jgi:hypothetical protein
VRRRPIAGGMALVVGFAVAAVVAFLGPRGAPPLYDGVVTIDPYRYLEPVSGQLGGAKGSTQTLPVVSGSSPIVAIATPEQPPQAQLIANQGAFVLPPGTTAITVSIVPVPPAVKPPNAHVAGNVYRISITTQAGAPVSARSDAQVTLALRAPANVGAATFEQLSGGTWTPLPAAAAGFPGTFETTGLTDFGDFALIVTGSGTTGPLEGLAGMILGLLIVGILLALLGWTLLRWGVSRAGGRR